MEGSLALAQAVALQPPILLQALLIRQSDLDCLAVTGRWRAKDRWSVPSVCSSEVLMHIVCKSLQGLSDLRWWEWSIVPIVAPHPAQCAPISIADAPDVQGWV